MENFLFCAVCNLRHRIPTEIFRCRSNYHYHFIIKKLGREFKGEVNCLRENNEKYQKFLVSIKK